MSVPVRRAIAWACLPVCTVIIVITAVAVTVRAWPPAAVLQADVPAVVSILAARVYLRATERRQP